MSICTKCDINTISTPGSAVCTDGDPGTVSNEDRTECGKFIVKFLGARSNNSHRRSTD